jgi:hypothetical protein
MKLAKRRRYGSMPIDRHTIRFRIMCDSVGTAQVRMMQRDSLITEWKVASPGADQTYNFDIGKKAKRLKGYSDIRMEVAFAEE